METLEIYRGDTVDLNFQLFVESVPMPIGDGIVVFAAKKNVKSSSYDINPKECKVIDGTLGMVSISLTEEETNRTDTLMCELEYRNLGKTITIWQGYLSFLETIILPSKNNVTVSLIGVPGNYTTARNVSISINDPNILEYKFKHNSENWSLARNVSMLLELSGLLLGKHTLKILGKTSLGWEDEPDAQVLNWEIIEVGSSISPIPEPLTTITDHEFSVIGVDLEKYKVKINDLPWEEKLIDEKISLVLTSGFYKIQVLGIDKYGVMQREAEPTTIEFEVI